MADYRQWCSWCNCEVGFGRHSLDCEFVHAQSIARKEEQEFETDIRAEYRAKTPEECREEYRQLCITIRALSEACNQAERKARFLQDYVGDRMEFNEKLKEDGLTWLR